MNDVLKVKTYICLKCGAPVKLAFMSGRSTVTWRIFKKMLDAGLCRNCYCEELMPKTADKIMGGLCKY